MRSARVAAFLHGCLHARSASIVFWDKGAASQTATTE